MTQEEKNLLIKDLCGRLPYGVKVQSYNDRYDIETIETLQEIDSDGYISTFECETLKCIAKPYLFPMSSMTEEQREEFLNIQAEERKILFDALIEYRYGKRDKKPVIAPYKQIEWLNKNNFD